MSNTIISPPINSAIETLNQMVTKLYNILYNSNVLLYQQIPQKQINYPPYGAAIVDYNYIAPNLQYYLYFGTNQIQSVIDYYVEQANIVLAQIKDYGLEAQLAQKINDIKVSITYLNLWAIALYNNQQNNFTVYTTPYAMSIRSALLLNNLSLNNMGLVLIYNMNNVDSFNYIPAGTRLILL